MSGKLLHHVGPTFGFCLVLFSPNFSIEAATTVALRKYPMSE